MKKTEKGIFGEDRNGVTIKEQVGKYLSYWYIFLICLIICIGAGLFYIYYTPEKYIATTSILVRGSEGSNNNPDLIEDATKVTREANLNNEMLLLGASNLMERTVQKNNFNIFYYKKARILYNEIYTYAPFRLIPQNPGDSTGWVSLNFKSFNNKGGVFETLVSEKMKALAFTWGKPFTVGGKTFILEPKREIKNNEGDYSVSWQPVTQTAAVFLADLGIKTFDNSTSVIQLSLKTENYQKGIDVLNALFAEFYRTDIEERSKLSASTVQFIDDRLLLISKELKSVEGNQENYQVSNALSDIKGQLSQSLENSSTVSKTIKDLGIQQGVVNMILSYFAKPDNSNKLVPSSLGLDDATLSSLISQYNELQLKREREAPLVAPNSTVMQSLNSQIANVKSSILESLNNINKNLRLQESGFEQQNSQYRSFLSSVPHNERVLQEIKRKQTITEGLYLYLLQKREEAAISSTASKVAHYKQIDPAKGFGPVEPNASNTLVYAALLGLFLATGLIYAKGVLNDKVRSKQDISKRLSIPVAGEINHIASRKRKVIEVLERSLVSEQFRSLRTNLSFLLKQQNGKVIMITSSVSGDGKSFISLNLASVFAMPGKKTALLEFDIRHPVINDNLYVDNTRGITDFIKGNVTELSEIVRVVEEVPNLHIYPCGPVPDNPADMLLSDKIPDLFKLLRSAYDYIIIDAAPIGLVSDPVILGKHSDLTLYIIRQQSTFKKDLDFIEETTENNSLSNVHLVLNDVNTSHKAKYSKYYNY